MDKINSWLFDKKHFHLATNRNSLAMVGANTTGEVRKKNNLEGRPIACMDIFVLFQQVIIEFQLMSGHILLWDSINSSKAIQFNVIFFPR